MYAQNSNRWLALCVAFANALTPALTDARKPDKPGGGGGGGDDGGGGDQSAYTIIRFMPSGSNAERSYVADLNEIGKVVGGLEFVDDSLVALHLDVGTGVYTTLPSGGADASVSGLNNADQIVGQLGNADAAFWPSPNDTPILLPVPGDALLSGALKINDTGIVIGGYVSSEGVATGVVWRVWDDGNAYFQIDSKAGWDHLRSAHHINNSGLITGSGLVDRATQGFVMIPNH